MIPGPVQQRHGSVRWEVWCGETRLGFKFASYFRPQTSTGAWSLTPKSLFQAPMHVGSMLSTALSIYQTFSPRGPVRFWSCHNALTLKPFETQEQREDQISFSRSQPQIPNPLPSNLLKCWNFTCYPPREKNERVLEIWILLYQKLILVIWLLNIKLKPSNEEAVFLWFGDGVSK